MIKSFVSLAFAIAVSLLAGCVVAPIPQQTYGSSGPAVGNGYVAPLPAAAGQPTQPTTSATIKPKLEESALPSGSKENTCRLRINGKTVEEKTAPSSLAKEEVKPFCDKWQRGRAEALGLI